MNLRYALTLALCGTSLAFGAVAQEMTPPAQLPAGTYQLDKTHASVTWKVSHLGLSDYTARFADIDATLTIDPKNPAGAKLTAKVNPLSVKTDYPNAKEKDFDKKLGTDAAWFNGTKFPEISFTSNKVTPTGATTATVEGTLTMLGVSKPMTLNVTYNGGYASKPFNPEGTASLGFSATGKIKRSEWGFTTYVPAIGDEVEILIEAEFDRAPQA